MASELPYAGAADELDDNQEHGDEDAAHDQAVEQDQRRGGDLGGGLLQLKCPRVEGLVPAGQGADKAGAAAQRIGEAPLQLARAVHGAQSFGQLDALLAGGRGLSARGELWKGWRWTERPG